MATPQSRLASPYSRMFGHHEDFARHLVDDTPSPLDRISRRNRVTEGFSQALTDVLQDHVVRGSRSSAATRSASSNVAPESLRGNQDSHLSFTAPMLSEIDPNNQRLRPPLLLRSSPTPSLKKKKAEQILQQHGSPPGVRVTAGGRIVPSEHSPLCSPRYGYSAIQRNGGLIKFAPGYPPPPKTFPNFAKSLPNGFVAQDPNGRLYQMVDGRFLHIPDINGIPQLYITAPNVNNLAWGQFNSTDSAPLSTESKHEIPSRSDAPGHTPGPNVTAQIAALEKQYDKLELERRGLDKAEVLKRSELTGKAYSQLVQKRRELVNRQDEIRRSIKSLQDDHNGGESASGMRSSGSSPDVQFPQYPMQAHFPQMAQWNEDQSMSQQHAPLIIPQDPQDQHQFQHQVLYPGGFPPFLNLQPYGFPVSAGSRTAGVSPSNGTIGAMPPMNVGVPTVQSLQYSGPHSKDINVTPSVQATKSALNPMSPAYQPAGGRMTIPERKTPTEPAKMAQANKARSIRQESERSVRQSSSSSFATADFFPNNPKDHSLNPGQYQTSGESVKHETKRSSPIIHRTGSEETIAQPEMERHNVNWNPTIPDQVFHRSLPAGDKADENKSPDVEAQTKQSTPPLTPRLGVNDDFGKGYHAGLRRSPISSEPGKVFLAGYCKGLLQSASVPEELNERHESVPPSRPVVRLPSATTGSEREVEQRAVSAESTPRRPPLPEAGLAAIRQAIAAPSNEMAILSPDPDGPSVDSVTDKSLGGWAKRKAEEGSDENIRVQSTALGQAGFPDSASENNYGAQRSFSVQTQPAGSSTSAFPPRIHPGFRVLSTPGMDWKSSTSMAHVAGMATGYFAQFDGTASKSIAECAGASVSTKATTPRFEESVPGAQDPPSPGKGSGSSSPKKPVSPAKAKFAAIAGKAGIKVRTDRPPSKESNELEPMTPQERRRWRDVWKKRNTGSAE